MGGNNRRHNKWLLCALHVPLFARARRPNTMDTIGARYNSHNALKENSNQNRRVIFHSKFHYKNLAIPDCQILSKNGFFVEITKVDQ